MTDGTQAGSDTRKLDLEPADHGGLSKAQGEGESQGGAYPNPHSGKRAKAGADTFLGHGGQTEIGYHGKGQLGEDEVEEKSNPNSPAKDG
jgi:hypothetical protein